MPWIEANLVLVAAIAAVVLLLAIWLLLVRRRTRVALTALDELGTAGRNQTLIDSAPVARRDAPRAAPVSPAAADLARLKGVGPKLIAQLNTLGVTSLAQIAAWNDAEIDRIDAQLGRFSGRIRQDDWVGQAQLLESGDQAAYQSRFGRM